ncbi:MAG: glycosyltransferase family 2 protein, partial [Candidatus Omnitrophica bacterium]|nr:glycosyltransferase family 2 protein [Candidatus Omnitrophota bacterium]
MENKVPVSVVVIAKNEENNIVDCLGSCFGWADEIILVDDESTDRTIEIAKKFANKVIIKKMLVEGTHRNWAYAQAKNKWVLSLDADESVTPELKQEITGAIKSDKFVSYS